MYRIVSIRAPTPRRRSLPGHPRQPRQPLIRLRVEYSDEAQLFQVVRFGQQFTGRVTNWEEMILLKRERAEVDAKDVKDGPAMTQPLPRVGCERERRSL